MAPQIDCRVTERRTFYGQVHVVGDDHLLAGGHRHLTSDDNLFAGAEKRQRMVSNVLSNWLREENPVFVRRLYTTTEVREVLSLLQ